MKMFIRDPLDAYRIFGSRNQMVEIPENWVLLEYRAEGAVFQRPLDTIVLPYHMIGEIVTDNPPQVENDSHSHEPAVSKRKRGR